MASDALHSTLTANELHYSKINVISGSPGLPPTYIGESCFDSTNNIFYVGTGISSLADWDSISGTGLNNAINVQSGTSYTVVPNDNASLIRMTNTGARSVTLPTTPLNGFSITIEDGSGNAYTNNITVNTPQTFDGGSNTYKMVSNYQSVTFVYSSSSTSWLVKGNYGGFQPTYLRLRGILGNALNIQTEDTSSIIMSVNSVGVLTLANTSVSLNVSNVNALTVNTTNFEIKKIFLLDDATDLTKQLTVSLSGATTSTKTTLAFVQTANRTLTFPDLTDTLVSKTSTDILTNKSFNNTTTILAANQLNFNNSGNTFHTSLKAGANAVNLDMTLPTTAPSAGQVLYSVDTAGTLSWITGVNPSSQTFTVTSGTNTLPINTTTVIITSATSPDRVNGITAGSAGQELTVINQSTDIIYFINEDSGVTANNRIHLPFSTAQIAVEVGFSIKFQYSTNTNRWVPATNVSTQSIGTVNGLSITGYIGEQIQSTLISAYALPTTTNSNPADINLTAGNWDIYFCGTVSSTTSGFIKMWISTVASGGTETLGENEQQVSLSAGNGGVITIVLPRVNITNPLGATYHINAYTNCSTGAIIYGRAKAVRAQ